MHEASIAESLLDIVIENAKKQEAKEIVSVTIKVGKLSGVQPDSLLFAFDALKESTAAANCNLVIEEIPVIGICNICGHEDKYDNFIFSCNSCGSFEVRMISGEELNIKEIEVEI
jgi:hydrogenase nickel incorporation protein HypA/HybF